MDNYSASLQGLAGNAKASKPPSTIEELSKRLTEVRGSLSENSLRLQNLLDRAFGASPEASPVGAPRAVPSGAMGGLSERIEDLETACASQRQIVNRLETLV